jgi:hypothetical protein
MKPKHPHGPPMTLGNVSSLGLALLINLTSILNLTSEVGAGAYRLSCSGTLSGGASKPPQPWITALTLDTENQTITVDDTTRRCHSSKPTGR